MEEYVELLKCKRIMIIGNNGSGKSYLAKKLSELTGIPFIHLDVEFWGPGWTQPSANDWVDKQLKMINQEKWIIDGNHTGTMELRFKEAEVIIFLDMNRLSCLYGVFKRTGKKRSDMPHYLDERFDSEYFKFIKGLWNFKKTRKKTIINLCEKYSKKPVLVLKSKTQVNKFLKQFERDLKQGVPNE